MKEEMPKRYNPNEVEDDIYAKWLNSGYFTPENLPDLKNRKDIFSIVLPPPNVTGTLHMGHAVMLALQDAMVRFARMSGARTLWLPGTDHAAIATESKVEKILIDRDGKTRHDLGREKFLEKVNEFARNSHDTIVGQMKKMGTSVDWTREAYTLDEERSRAVKTAFVKMYDDGLIYRGFRVINWDPKGQTAVSDDEVEYKAEKTKLYTFKYWHDFPIPIATTRPETKVGDTAVAVHPNGKYKEFIGQTFTGEFAGASLQIKIVGDDAVDEEFGTGAVGVTPAHSIVDSEIAERHNLQMKQVIGEDGTMLASAGDLVRGKSVLEARKMVVDWLKENHLLEKEEEIEHNLAIAQRSGGVIEPLPKKQWFIDVNKKFTFHQSKRAPINGLQDGQKISLKEAMRHIVDSGAIKIIPDRFEKVYYHWIDNLRDWNISRQIWFGHRIPVWYKGEDIFVGIEPPADQGWERDPDTLDTWFSSGLWTFSTLGWPQEDSEDLTMYHPTSVLETGYDILFFWVARMILMSVYFLGEVPFHTVYLHGLVRAEDGSKMSKSKGNVIDPLDMIEKYGADATRLSLLIGTTPGNDTRLSEEKVASFRNFTNKLWNISRFIFMNVDEIKSIDAVEPKTLDDKWILSEFYQLSQEIDEYYRNYRYSLLGEKLREFTWNKFADVYLENAKIQKGKSTQEILLYILERLLVFWHPLAPFVTEEIYKRFDGGDLLMVHAWPQISEFSLSDEESKNFLLKQAIIEKVRVVRAQKGLPWKERLKIALFGCDNIANQEEALKQRLKLSEIDWRESDNPQIEIAGEIYNLEV